MKKFFSRLKLSFDRSFSGNWWKQILWLIVITLLLIITGWVILVHYYEIPPDASLRKSIGYFFDTDSFHTDVVPKASDTNRLHHISPFFSALFTFLGMAVMGGMLISVIVNILTQRVDDYRKGYIRYGLSGHIVILGSGDKLINMVKDFCCDKQGKAGKSRQHIVVLTTSNVQELRDRLHTRLTEKEERRLILLYGRRDSEEELRRLKIWKASKVYIIGEEHETDTDSQSIAALNIIGSICADAKRSVKPFTPLYCNILLEAPSTFHMMQFSDYKSHINPDTKNPVIELHVSNLYKSWSQNVFVTGSCDSGKISYLPLDRTPVTPHSTRYVHLIVTGMTKMGYAMAETCANIAHYPNYGKGIRTRITFIDPDAGREMDSFVSRHEHLFALSHYTYLRPNHDSDDMECMRDEHPVRENDFMDVEWQFVRGTTDMPAVRNLLKRSCEDNDAIVTIVVCGDSPEHNVADSIALPSVVYDKQIPVLVYQKYSAAILNIAADADRYAALRPFGMDSEFYHSNNEVLVGKARKVNFLYNYAYSIPKPEPSEHEDAAEAECRLVKQAMQDFVMPPDSVLTRDWHKLSLVNQWSNIHAAGTLDTKYRSLGLNPATDSGHVFNDDEIELLADMEHRRWMAERLFAGFRPPTAEEEAKIRKGEPVTVIDRNGNPVTVCAKEAFKLRYIHCDIKPFKLLNEDRTGKNASIYDKIIVCGMPYL